MSEKQRNNQKKSPENLAFEAWRILKIQSEFSEAIDKLADIAPAVSIFGSARIEKTDKFFKITQKIAQKLSQAGISVISGGGPGIMEAANMGAKKGKKGLSVGLNISGLNHEQKPNDFQDISANFHHFFVRKVMFSKYCSAYVCLPGGFGTLDEFSEMLVLMQTNKAPQIPLILVGKEFWSGLLEWIEKQMLNNGLISKKDLEIYRLVDSAEEALELLKPLINEQLAISN